jgi:hypothetical protein
MIDALTPSFSEYLTDDRKKEIEECKATIRDFNKLSRSIVRTPA